MIVRPIYYHSSEYIEVQKLKGYIFFFFLNKAEDPRNIGSYWGHIAKSPFKMPENQLKITA